MKDLLDQLPGRPHLGPALGLPRLRSRTYLLPPLFLEPYRRKYTRTREKRDSDLLERPVGQVILPEDRVRFATFCQQLTAWPPIVGGPVPVPASQLDTVPPEILKMIAPGASVFTQFRLISFH